MSTNTREMLERVTAPYRLQVTIPAVPKLINRQSRASYHAEANGKAIFSDYTAATIDPGAAGRALAVEKYRRWCGGWPGAWMGDEVRR